MRDMIFNKPIMPNINFEYSYSKDFFNSFGFSKIFEDEKPSLNINQETLVNFISKIAHDDFDTIYDEIFYYRLNNYENNIEDVIYPYDYDIRADLLIKKMEENNYEKYPNLKKWIDKTFCKYV